MQRQQNLTKNQKIVLDIIEKSTEPLKAYSILSNVKKKGINAPPQVYRALDKLVDMGKIHKIESKNAFVACQNSNCKVSKAAAFSICESCEEVTEIDNSTKTDQDSSGLPTNPFEIVEMIRRQNSMNDATNPSDAIDDALKSFNSLEEK